MDKKFWIIFLLSLTVVFITIGFRSDVKDGRSNQLRKTSSVSASSTGMVGEAYAFRINKIDMPLDNIGKIAQVTVSGLGSGQIDGKTFLFAGGFIMSGLARVDTGVVGNRGEKTEMWANAVAPASRVEDYRPGPWKSPDDPNAQIYVVDVSDPPFGSAWQDWIKAVALGADFYDGDKDGVYNPQDKNGNGKWDPDEDRPDLLGDRTAWCVFHDGKKSADRRWVEVAPRGIEIQQSLFGFRSSGVLGNMLFLRYRIVSRKLNNNNGYHDSVYFSVWTDPDLGNYNDDLIGCDTIRSAGFVYNNGADNVFGPNPPCFLIDFFQGPVTYIPGRSFTDNNGNGKYDPGIDTPLDTAYSRMGNVKGVDTLIGATNLRLASFVNYVQSDPNRGDPARASEARGYTMGRLKDGTPLNPCRDTYGTVYGTPTCDQINPNYWYSGNVHTQNGWIYTTPGDVRMMQNIGPFQLKPDTTLDIVVAYVVGRGTSAINSVHMAQQYSDFAQFIYNRNFATPPAPEPVNVLVRTTDNSINLTWNTKDQTNYVSKAYIQDTVLVWDLRFEGYEVIAYRQNSTAAEESGVRNSKVIARYDLANSYEDILIENSIGERIKTFEKGVQLDDVFKGDMGRISLTIDSDPITGGPIIKNHPYFIAVVPYAISYDAIKPVDPSKPIGTYYISNAAPFQSVAPAPSIIIHPNIQGNLAGGIRPGTDMYSPFATESPTFSSSNNIGDVQVTYEELDRTMLTGKSYRVNFFRDTLSNRYSTFWRLSRIDKTINGVDTLVVKLDSQKVYNVSKGDEYYKLKMADGVLVRVQKTEPKIKRSGITYKKMSATRNWFKPFFTDGGSELVYMGDDSQDSSLTVDLLPRKGKFATVTKNRQIEVRFGETSKAYRYIPNALGTSYLYAEAPTSIIPGRPNAGKGFVDVPFAVYVKDPRYKEERRLNVGFVENRTKQDGVWDPDTLLASAIGSREYILVFNSTYSSDPLPKYTGGTFNSVTAWANPFQGWIKPAAWPNTVISAQDSAINRLAWSDVMYTIGLKRDTATVNGVFTRLFYESGDILTIPIDYPILNSDEFSFSTHPAGTSILTKAQKNDIWKKVNVYPNPLFAFNPQGSYLTRPRTTDEPFVTFSNLPTGVTVRIFTLSGQLIRTLTDADKLQGIDSPFLEWDLRNKDNLRVASGMYIAIVSSPEYGEKILKFAIIMPQKQIQRY